MKEIPPNMVKSSYLKAYSKCCPILYQDTGRKLVNFLTIVQVTVKCRPGDLSLRDPASILMQEMWVLV